MMLKASIVEILDGQPTCWACNLRSATTSSPPATGRSTPAPPIPPRVPPPQVVGCYWPPLIYKWSLVDLLISAHPSLLPAPPPILCPLHSNAAHLVPPVHDCRPREVFYVYSLSNLSVQTVWIWARYFHTEVDIRPGVVMVNRMKFQDRLVCILRLLVIEMLHTSL